jgi:hypothetical protein
MSTRPQTVSASIELLMIASERPDRAVQADLSYSPADPYAVAIVFHAATDERVEWTFARSLLVEGVLEPVGVGDVHVWPATHAATPTVCLALSSPSGQALFEAPLPAVVQFLTATFVLVPSDCESQFVDVDAGLAALLGIGDELGL